MCLDVIKIPRIKNEDWREDERTELHVLCDDLETGYGAVAYAWYVPARKPTYSVLLFGDIVLVALETTTRGNWPMGIMDAFEGDGDGLVQTAGVHTVAARHEEM
ncbi:unnamed protein product [Echinostoma caproni]|uniref:SH3 domain-containing protein n=1 Tax=Echinostoma caproni TaxID=27848 RepID=A0A183AUX9_9TREM|nr:unnamed protein product [Echinostoma caproni]